MTGLAYDVSKAAVNRFTLGLAEELRPYSIAVNVLMVDNTVTEGWSYLNPAADKSSWYKPEMWASYALYVATRGPGCLYRTVPHREGRPTGNCPTRQFLIGQLGDQIVRRNRIVSPATLLKKQTLIHSKTESGSRMLWVWLWEFQHRQADTSYFHGEF